ncbi:HD domain-containing protein [Nitratifractor sp.]
MIDPCILKLFFSTASIERWNDQIRPVDFVELDKQAHKAIAAWLLGRIEEVENRTPIDWKRLIEFGIVEFAYRAVLTDLKPPVFHHLMAYRREELNRYVRSQLESCAPEELLEAFDTYCTSDEEEIERRILGAAHYLASRWEFGFIYRFAPESYGVAEIRDRLESEVEEYLDLTGIRRLEMGMKSRNFLELCAMLRFQKRWARTPRLPQTSVLGHMYFVAVTTWMLGGEAGIGRRKRINDFHAALFHDIAEALTRDIISPVKYGVEGLSEVLAEYEHSLVEERLLPLLPRYLREEMRFYVTDEFADKIRLESGEVHKIGDPLAMCDRHNDDTLDGIDGTLMKAADHLGAFMEAHASIRNGVDAPHLRRAVEDLKRHYAKRPICRIDIAALMEAIETSD